MEMKKASFNLTGKAIDCRELPEMGDAGKEIFRALKVALGCEHDDEIDFYSLEVYDSLGLLRGNTMEFDMWEIESAISEGFESIQPIDVLGQARIDAAKDGATIVFEGDAVPKTMFMETFFDSEGVLAYKLIEEKQPSIESRILAEKVGAKHNHYFKDVSDLDEVDVYRVCDLFEVNDPSGAKQHAIKKLLCSGQRGAKDERKDLEEARDTIIRKLAMMTEDRE